MLQVNLSVRRSSNINSLDIGVTAGMYPISPIPVSFPPFDGLEGLGSPDKGLHVAGFYLEYRGRVFHGRIKVRQLLVACRAVTVALDCQRAPLVRQLTETLCVLFNRFLQLFQWEDSQRNNQPGEQRSGGRENKNGYSISVTAEPGCSFSNASWSTQKWFVPAVDAHKTPSPLLTSKEACL